MAIETTLFDASEFITTEEDQIELLHDAFESGEPSYIAVALGVVAKARGMSVVAKEAGVTREALYKALSKDGDPRLSTFTGVLKALGLKLSLAPIKASEKQSRPAKKAAGKRSEPLIKSAPQKSKAAQRTPAKKPTKAA